MFVSKSKYPDSTRYDFTDLKIKLFLLAATLVLGAVMLAVGTPIFKYWQLERSVNTYYHQAEQAITPAKFAESLRSLNQALEDQGMTSGKTSINGSENARMEYKRSQYSLMAERADKLSQSDLASIEVSIGLSEMKTNLARNQTNAYWFWFYNQGGLWLQLWVPLACFVLGVSIFVLTASQLKDFKVVYNNGQVSSQNY